ncbi:auxin-responsive protein SAUR32-like [Actinidia eriantha]|uniref:auxin-responsive protein SAUR32-like n=1 Tax=Actinidia eriantha TaxID=165200 RepID=UPI002590AD4D|nr:auxin-responsive protein SAUR32-like [Actinidia eriantha]
MGSGDRIFLNFHLRVPHLHPHPGGKREEEREIPRGCVAVVVGQGKEQQRVVVPVIYINHPLFMKLLKEAEEEYGFDQKGPINIPCHVDEFRYVKGIIDKQESLHHHHQQQQQLLLCFRV